MPTSLQTLPLTITSLFRVRHAKALAQDQSERDAVNDYISPCIRLLLVLSFLSVFAAKKKKKIKTKKETRKKRHLCIGGGFISALKTLFRIMIQST